MLVLLLAATPPEPGGDSGSDLPIDIPELPEGTPGWVYAVVFAAVAIVVLVVKLPALIDGINSLLGREAKHPAPVAAPVAPPPPPGPQQAAVDQDAELLALLVGDLREEVKAAKAVNADLDRRLTKTESDLTDERVKNARIETEASQMRTELEVLRRQGHHYFGGT